MQLTKQQFSRDIKVSGGFSVGYWTVTGFDAFGKRVTERLAIPYLQQYQARLRQHRPRYGTALRSPRVHRKIRIR